MVSIIILSYNTEKLLKACLSSLYQHLAHVDFEMIVVDNASSDESIAMIKREFKHVRVIESKENLGFAKGINYAADFAKGEYLLFLNSDTEVRDNSFGKMADFLKEHEDAAVIGAKLLNKDGSTSKSFDKFYTLSEVFVMLFGKRKDPLANSSNIMQVDWVSGGCMMIKKQIFEEVKGFDPHFFMYIEDMELCYRLRKKGYTIYFDPNVVVSHLGQGSSNRSFAIIHIYKGLLYFYKKHMPGWQYHLVKVMLKCKGRLAILLGQLTHNEYLSSTYRKALQFSV